MLEILVFPLGTMYMYWEILMFPLGTCVHVLGNFNVSIRYNVHVYMYWEILMFPPDNDAVVFHLWNKCTN